MSILKVDQLEVSYESSYVIRNLNLELEKGKVTTIIGPNGCGKSTLLKTMGRIIKQKHGTVFFKGKDLTSLNTKKVAQELAILSQSPLTPAELTVEALVAYGRYPYRKNLKELNAKDQKIIEWAMEVTQTIEFR
ncbi:ABC transporter ATP-binding protein, partial [Neobacillus sp.]|uniref:ABC transporter ATP-binding protein n=1 Tax=Neobacillus sp. TaxID=2675273 RepID=UPI0035B52A8B